MDRPRTRYAWNGDVALAYQVIGDGPSDLLYMQGWCSNIDLAWESPYLGSFLRGLAGNARVILTDRRGWGCSDRFSPSDVPPFETMTDDLAVVLDAAGSNRPAIFATVECAPIAALFAATHPERTAALILCDPTIAYVATEDTPWLPTHTFWEGWADELRHDFPLPRWWHGPPDHPERDWFERYVRASVAPGALVAEFRRFLDTDIRPILPTVSVPTLVLVDPTLEGMDDADPRSGRFVAERIPGARLEETPAGDRLNWFHWYGRGDAIVRAVGSFLSELRAEEAALDRVLATVLFTDIVGSTERAASLGDRAWGELVERHHAIVRAMLARYRGVEVDTAGDGFFATFDGPARAVRCARAIADAIRPLGVEIRAGVHTGEVQTMAEKVGGLGVVIGSRIGAMARPSEVLASSTVKDLTAGSGLLFEDAGEHELKGVPGTWHVYRVVDVPNS